MSSHDNEPLDVPSIVPERDDDRPGGRRRNGVRSTPEHKAAGSKYSGDRGSGGAGRTVGLVLLAMLLAGWSGWQQWLLLQSEQQLAGYERRVADLEQRLSMTDESVSESSVTMQVKLKELDSEIRKLWDNVWKRSRAQLEDHEQRLGTLNQALGTTRTTLEQAEKALAEQKETLAAMRKRLDQTGNLDAVVELNKRQLQEQQVVLETLSSQVRQFQETAAKLEQRVVANEEWVQSINAFRRQVNRDLLALKERAGTP